MTVVHAFKGYGEHDYGTLPYGGGTAQGSSGMQFTSVLPDTLSPEGMQFSSTISAFVNPQGFQAFTTNLGFFCPGYGEVPYGTVDYGVAICLAQGGVQFESIINALNNNGVQFEANVVDVLEGIGVQWESVIVDFLNNNGIQFESKIVDFLNEQGLQFKGIIVDQLNNNAIQFEAVIKDFLNPIGVQFDVVSGVATGIQYRVNLYNTNRLRILCDFSSRGSPTTGGTNAWGFAIGTGKSWKTNSQATGDFDINNLNTDIVEQVYRTLSTTGVQLSCDTEIAQGVFVDTFAILNHNMTTGATINLIGSNTSNFSVIGTTIPITSRVDNIYYIAPTLPLESFRYWRVDIDDASNPASFIEIGTILFGSAQIFQGECIIDRLIKSTRHFADSVRTEGFTSVKNDRSIKTSVNLKFSKLDFTKGNFQALDAIFKSARTAQKCLWIPTPSTTDPSFTERFAVFAKLTEIPEQEHLVMGSEEGDYIDLTVNLDEAE